MLSACETGVIGHGDYDQALGMPAVLLGIGCRGVISSLWRVPDQSSALLFARFYQLWPRVHELPAPALRAAQSWLRKATAAEVAAAFPTLYSAPPPAVPAALRERWTVSKPFAGEDHWAGFCYAGS